MPEIRNNINQSFSTKNRLRHIRLQNGFIPLYALQMKKSATARCPQSRTFSPKRSPRFRVYRERNVQRGKILKINII
jgi:hypothetical protein